MDERTEQLWRNRAAPFDGLTLWTPTLATARLREAVTTIVAVLEGYVDRPRLHMAEDWHEHDGYLSGADVVAWSQLLAALQGDDALRRASPADDLVRRAWRAEDNSFYLRWQHPDDPSQDDPASGGDADFTASRSIVDSVARRLTELGIDVEIGPAAEFFADRFAG
jgi:hypothetical protein